MYSNNSPAIIDIVDDIAFKYWKREYYSAPMVKIIVILKIYGIG